MHGLSRNQISEPFNMCDCFGSESDDPDTAQVMHNISIISKAIQYLHLYTIIQLTDYSRCYRKIGWLHFLNDKSRER